MPRLTKEEMQSAINEYYIFSTTKEQESFARHQRINDIMEALSLMDPLNKKIENPLPPNDSGLPSSGETVTEYFTVYENTIKGEKRQDLIDKLIEYLNGDL